MLMASVAAVVLVMVAVVVTVTLPKIVTLMVVVVVGQLLVVRTKVMMMNCAGLAFLLPFSAASGAATTAAATAQPIHYRLHDLLCLLRNLPITSGVLSGCCYCMTSLPPSLPPHQDALGPSIHRVSLSA